MDDAQLSPSQSTCCLERQAKDERLPWRAPHISHSLSRSGRLPFTGLNYTSSAAGLPRASCPAVAVPQQGKQNAYERAKQASQITGVSKHVV